MTEPTSDRPDIRPEHWKDEQFVAGVAAMDQYLRECFDRVWNRPDAKEILAAFIAGECGFEVTKEHLAAVPLSGSPTADPPENKPKPNVSYGGYL